LEILVFIYILTSFLLSSWEIKYHPTVHSEKIQRRPRNYNRSRVRSKERKLRRQ